MQRSLLSMAVLLASSVWPAQSCTVGFTKYTDGDAFVAAVKTKGKHCLMGTKEKPITISGKKLMVRGKVEVHHVIFKDNDVLLKANAGFIFVARDGSFKSTSTTFTGGKASSGGAVVIDGGVFEGIDTTFSNNEAGGCGGAVLNIAGTFVCDGCTFTKNSASIHAGAIMSDSNAAYSGPKGMVTLTRSTFSGNDPGNCECRQDLFKKKWLDFRYQAHCNTTAAEITGCTSDGTSGTSSVRDHGISGTSSVRDHAAGLSIAVAMMSLGLANMM